MLGRYYLLRSQVDGLFLADCPQHGLHLTNRGEDVAMWSYQADGDSAPGARASVAASFCCTFSSAVSGRRITAQLARPLSSPTDALDTPYRLEVDQRVSSDMYDAVAGPVRLPSSHCAELRETGLTVLAGFSKETCAALRAAVLEATTHTVTDLRRPGSVTADRKAAGEDDSQQLQLSVPRARRGSTGGAGIQVLRDGEVIQGAPDAGGDSVTIPFESISSVEVGETLMKTSVDGPPACVTIRQVDTKSPFEFGVRDIEEAKSLAALIRNVAFDKDGANRAYEGVRRSRGFWDGEQGHLFGRMHCHPVVLWLLEQSFGGPARTGGHTPNAKVVMPQDGSWGPGQGWHSDTPYDKGLQFSHSGIPWPDPSLPLGIQCNVCVDAYTARNGGTAYVPLSHLRRGSPSLDPALGGYSTKYPPMPPEARHIEAPEGSIVMYHAATWHRQAVNTSAAPRIGLLQAFVPDAVAAVASENSGCAGDPQYRAAIEELAAWQMSEQPGSPSSEDVKTGWARFIAEGHAMKLNQRERDDLFQLLCGGEAERRLHQVKRTVDRSSCL